MHLLPHKSWNVWSKKNIEKVKQDEAKAKQEEDKKLKRQLEIEQEKRYDSLKSKAKKAKQSPDSQSVYQNINGVSGVSGVSGVNDATTLDNDDIEPGGPPSPSHPSLIPSHSSPTIVTSPSPQQPLKHINFFEELEQEELKQQSVKHIIVEGGGVGKKTSSSKQPNEEELADEKKKIAEDRFTPYLGKGSLEHQKLKPWYHDTVPSLSDVDKSKIEKKKSLEDPLLQMSKYLDQKKQFDEKKKGETKKTKTVEDLRKERLERERREQEKVSQILNGRTPSNSTIHRGGGVSRPSPYPKERGGARLKDDY